MPEGQYPKTNITVGANGALIEICVSEGTSVKSEISSVDMTNLVVMWISNKFQMIDQLQQTVQQLLAAQEMANQLQILSTNHHSVQEVKEQTL